VFVSLSGRTYLWSRVLEHIAESPITGYGYYASLRTLIGSSTVDNTYLEVALGTGAIGLVLFCFPIIITILGIVRSRPSASDSNLYRQIWMQCSCLLILLFVRSLTGPSFAVLHPNLTMFMVLIVSVPALSRLRYSERQRVSISS